MSAAPAPDWSGLAPRDVVNVKTGRTYRLVRADSVPATEASVAAIVAICNEPLVYEFLFRAGHRGAPYVADDARGFIRWIAEGWAAGTHFVFFVLDADGAVAACADIKSADLDAGEVGYWASAAHSGVMSPTVAALVDAARRAGYRGLFATARATNQRSAAVLLRNGFRYEPDPVTGPTGPRLRFTRPL